MGGKSKISHAKRSNQLHTKLSKQGKLKKRRNKKKISTSKPTSASVPVSYHHSGGEDDCDMDDMPIDEGDVSFVKRKESSNFLKTNLNIPDPLVKKKKRKITDDNSKSIESIYEGNNQVEPVKRQKVLLPIKTKDGVVARVEDLPESDQESEEISTNIVTEPQKSSLGLQLIGEKKEVTTADLIVAREQSLQRKKFRIGLLASGLLESPESKMANFKPLLEMLDETDPEVKLTVKKLTMVSLLEVFKDLIPAYQIKHQNDSNVKLKKEVKQLHDYENNLLNAYKIFLQKVEKLMSALKRKKGDVRVRTEAELKLAEMGLECLCDILRTHPYFNFSKNIVHLIVPFMSSSRENPRNIVAQTIKGIFRNDTRGEISLEIVRSINKLVKSKNFNIHPISLEVFLSLRLKDINLDEKKEEDIKKKKMVHKKHNILRLSKRERKREKRLKEVNRELLETKGEESKTAKQHYLTEITKIMFLIYFKILKVAPSSKLLKVALEGLAKFAHCINIDFYHDLIYVLDLLIEKEELGPEEQLCCVQTVFTVLSCQGASLNIDPIRFYTHLYNILFHFSAAKNHDNLVMCLTASEIILIKRRKQMSLQRLLAFTKRFATLACQVLPNGSIGLLAILRQILQLSKAAGILLDTDSGFGQGAYQPELEEPEYCNATSSALWELMALQRHYHPTVREFAAYVATLGEQNDDAKSSGKNYVKKSPEELFVEFDASQVRFNPPVQPPSNFCTTKSKPKKLEIANEHLKEYIKELLKRNSN